MLQVLNPLTDAEKACYNTFNPENLAFLMNRYNQDDRSGPTILIWLTLRAVRSLQPVSRQVQPMFRWKPERCSGTREITLAIPSTPPGYICIFLSFWMTGKVGFAMSWI